MSFTHRLFYILSDHLPVFLLVGIALGFAWFVIFLLWADE